jgi:cytochrome P450 monooxygenase-2
MIPSARPLLMDMWRDYTDMPSGNIAAWVMVTIAIGFTFFSTSFKRSQFPLVNAPAWWQFRAQKQYEYLQDGLNILRESREKFKGKPFRILTELGEMIVLPPDSAEAVKSSSDPSGLNFRLAILDVSCYLGSHVIFNHLTQAKGFPYPPSTF